MLHIFVIQNVPLSSKILLPKKKMKPFSGQRSWSSNRMATPASKGLVKAKPQKGSFPLDHLNECKQIAEKYTTCLRENNGEQTHCRHLSQQYLQCRMERGLMEKQSMQSLGFQLETSHHDTAYDNSVSSQPSAREHARSQQQQGYVAGSKRSRSRAS
jgi:cytochrome c oxidase assembly protein subunit 19